MFDIKKLNDLIRSDHLANARNSITALTESVRTEEMANLTRAFLKMESFLLPEPKHEPAEFKVYNLENLFTDYPKRIARQARNEVWDLVEHGYTHESAIDFVESKLPPIPDNRKLIDPKVAGKSIYNQRLEHTRTDLRETVEDFKEELRHELYAVTATLYERLAERITNVVEDTVATLADGDFISEQEEINLMDGLFNDLES